MNVPDDKTKLHPGSMLSPTALLRKQAEERLRHLEFLQQAKTINPAETRRLIHELNVHQIELEMQNDELQRTHIELEEMRARYFDLYNLAPVGYCTVGEKGVILEANLTAANLLGIAPRDLINQSFSRFIQNDDQDIYYLFRKRLDQTSTAQTCEVRLIRQDGTSFWAQLEAAIFPDAHGMAGSRVILSDITDRKTMEEEKSNQEAVNGQLQKAESLKRMAAAIAHHFNNKLHTVMGFLELSFEDIPPGNKAIPLLTMAREEANKASEVSRLMLTYLGHVTGKQEQLELSRVCREFLPLIEVTFPRNVVLKTDLPFPGPVIKANADHIRQILSNLLENAAEAADDASGSIHLTVKTLAAVNIPPTSSRFPADWQPDDIHYACLEIADQGCGIAAHDIEEIFSPFFTTKFTGRGLGLSVVLGLLKAHNGGITAESVPGKGSVFRVYLPVVAGKIIHQSDNSLTSEKIQANGTVLLVDDDNVVLDITSEMLSIIGFTVLKAANGVEAVEIFLEHKDDIRFVLSDVVMPRMNGWEMLLVLRQVRPGVPVILASGYHEEQTMEGVNHAERPQAFLGKPYSFQELKGTIQRILSAEKK